LVGSDSLLLKSCRAFPSELVERQGEKNKNRMKKQRKGRGAILLGGGGRCSRYRKESFNF